MSTTAPDTAPLRARDITVGYGQRTIITGLDVDIPEGELTVIVGPNACGKSTLLRSLARMLPVSSGVVELDGQPIGEQNPKAVARRLGLLPQNPVARWHRGRRPRRAWPLPTPRRAAAMERS